jgi:hypothetical protein
MRQFLRRKPEQQVGMLTALAERLERDLAELPEDAVPGEEWCRVAKLYQDGYRHLATLDRPCYATRTIWRTPPDG